MPPAHLERSPGRSTFRRVLMVYSTVDGHTLTICERMRQRLEARGHAVTLLSVDEALSLDITSFDCVVLGASIRYGRHRPTVHAFVHRHRAAFDRVPAAFFSVCAVSRKPGKDTPSGNAYFRKFVRQCNWTPALGACFAGRIDYARYRVVDRWMIRLIMWLTRGPTDGSAAHEFTDWNAVDAFADALPALELVLPPVAVSADRVEARSGAPADGVQVPQHQDHEQDGGGHHQEDPDRAQQRPHVLSPERADVVPDGPRRL